MSVCCCCSAFTSVLCKYVQADKAGASAPRWVHLPHCLLFPTSWSLSSAGVRMESHRLSLHSPRSSHDGLFGVRVQVQGFKGQPYVVLNSSGPESRRDISAITHQGGSNPDMLRRSAEEGRCLPESRPPSASSMLHYQKHPEILHPYDPQYNNLNFLPSAASAAGSGLLKTGRPAPTNKPRIPLPAEGPEEESESEAPSSGRQLPARSPNAVETESGLSVGQLISQFNSSQRRGRGGPRNRLDPEQCPRSRSLDSSRNSDSSSSSSSSSRASSQRGTRAGTAGGLYPPGSARARLLGGQTPLAKKKEEKTLSLLLKEHDGREAASPRAARLRRGSEKPSASTPSRDQTGESNEREAQVTLAPHTQSDWNRAY